jgi:hypothetical protein
MSRKSVQITLPLPPVAKPATLAPTFDASADSRGMDSWIAQARDASEAIGGTVVDSLGEAAFSDHLAPGGGVTFTVNLSAEPNPFEAAKIFFFLPQAALWFWTFGWAQRSLRGFPHWPR